MRFFILFVFIISTGAATAQSDSSISVTHGRYTFSWYPFADHAILKKNNQQAWEGGLLPAFWVQWSNGKKEYLKASVIQLSQSSHKIQLAWSNAATGSIAYREINNGIIFDTLSLQWTAEIPAIIELLFGTRLLTEKQRTVVSSLEFPFFPDWQADGYCIPAVKSSPVLSFFKSSIFGNSDIALGTFGTSGTPYGAAYPRPIYAAAMGGQFGWMAMGSGAVQDAAMYLQIRSTCGTMRYLYREDLWGAGNATRIWKAPLVLQFDSTAWDAYAQLFNIIGDHTFVDPIHQKAHWNSWGDFSKGDYNVRSITDVAKKFGAEELTLDMGWETSQSTAIPNLQHLPHFWDDIAYINQQKIDLGFWQSLIWIKDTAACGLTRNDLLLGADGMPRRNNIFHNPYWADWSYYCLDPSSSTARAFLRNRTQNLLRTTHAKLLKLDFAYALPPPDVAAPRNPLCRGEMYAYTLLKIISSAAREIDSNITIQYYGISPLLKPVYNLIALDDMADASGNEPEGHAQWSIWSALAGMNGSAIMASSGYNWNTDAEILLNTAIIGSPGSVLNRKLPDGTALPSKFLSKRKALNKWYRKHTGWAPLWLNSFKGSLEHEPSLNCWGRLEESANGKILTALSLRSASASLQGYNGIEKIKWTGKWAIIAQDQLDIFHSKNLVVIPFDAGTITVPYSRRPRSITANNLTGNTTYQNWKWQNGLLTIICKKPDDLMGYVIVGD